MFSDQKVLKCCNLRRQNHSSIKLTNMSQTASLFSSVIDAWLQLFAVAFLAAGKKTHTAIKNLELKM